MKVLFVTLVILILWGGTFVYCIRRSDDNDACGVFVYLTFGAVILLIAVAIFIGIAEAYAWALS